MTITPRMTSAENRAEELAPGTTRPGRRWFAAVVTGTVAVALSLSACTLGGDGAGGIGGVPASSDSAEESDGKVPDGTRLTPYSTDSAAVSKLDPALLSAVQSAADRAAEDGVAVLINSGWRSRSYQQYLLNEALAKYGSEAEASRWVATPDTSRHVTGDAVDIGSWDAAAWMDEHGREWGLCRIYDNEPWHFELATEPGGDCPRLKPDAGQGE